MTVMLPETISASREKFRHEALLYLDDADFLAGTLPFIQAGLALQEPILIAVRGDKIAVLRHVLEVEMNLEADAVRFVDMGILGHNPARIIPAWLEFVNEHAAKGRSTRGIGEPVCGLTHGSFLTECLIHEALLNVAFAGTRGFQLLCPYDTRVVDTATLTDACRSHPFLSDSAGANGFPEGLEHQDPWALLEAPLPEPPRHSSDFAFRAGTLYRLRAVVTDLALRFGMDADRTDALLVATNEVAINSLRHGGGEGIFRAWRDSDHMVCEIRDAGRFQDLLAGRRPSETGDQRGLWLVNRLCDLVQIRSSSSGSVVRLHMALVGQAEMRLTQLTLHDQLTGLGNRTMLWNRLEHAVAASERDDQRHAVLFCDVDDFKAINDTYGHRVGDEILLAVAGRLRDGARPGDTIARLGGDEFVVLCEGVARDSDAQVIADRVALALRSPVKTSAGTLTMSMSVGLAMSRPGQSADDLVAEADTAMYAAKRARGGVDHT